MSWLWFAVVQLISLAASLAGHALLILPCLLHAWEPVSARFDNRVIDRWSWGPLNYVYGNPEDGVSGAQALIWTATGKVPYMPGADPAWRAYCWNARNSANNLKYVFAWADGPLKTGTLWGRKYKIGWQLENGIKVPVVSWS